MENSIKTSEIFIQSFIKLHLTLVIFNLKIFDFKCYINTILIMPLDIAKEKDPIIVDQSKWQSCASINV